MSIGGKTEFTAEARRNGGKRGENKEKVKT